MMLKTSSRKINPFWGMIKSTCRKNFGIIIVLCIIALLYCPGVYIVNFQSFFEDRVTLQNVDGITPEEFTKTFGSVIAAFAPIFVMIFNFVNFSYLYKKSSSDVFHAFPLTRTELLLSRMISSLVSALTPIVLCISCYVTIVLANPWLGDFGTLFYYMALTLVITLLWSSFMMIFVVCAGGAFDLVLSFLGTNLTIIFIGLIAGTVFEAFLLGYRQDYMNLLTQISIPFFCGDHESVGFWIRSIIYIALFTAAAILLYNRRKAEKGGTAYAYKFMYYICSVLISICGGYFIGMLFDLSADDFSATFWFFSHIGAILFAMIYGLITNRGFKGVLRSVITGAVAWGLIIVLVVSSIFGGFGFTSRVPSENLIKEVTVTTMGENITFENAETTIKLHKKAIESAKEYKKDNRFISNNYRYNYTGVDMTYVDFAYTLKGGSTVMREFDVPFDSIDNELLAVIKDEGHYKDIIKKSYVNEPDIRSISFSYSYSVYNNPYNSTTQEVEDYITVEQYKEFLDMYWQDIQSLDTASGIGENSIRFVIDIGDETEYFWLDFNDDFYYTMRFIDNFRYPYLYN